jgi:putative ABC transport system ATP-binding protein
MPWWRKRGVSAEASEPSEDLTGPLIRLESVSKVFRSEGEETRALDSVSVEIARGEYVSVSGPSGCGKSTFLSIIGLLDTPTSGR